MITSKTQLFNVALSAVGTRSSIASDLENSREAEICRLWYTVVLDQVLEAAHWSTARKFARLALVKERDTAANWIANDPFPEYIYMYAAPSDMLIPRYQANYERFEYAVVNDQRVIMSNVEDAILCYTYRQERIDLWSSALQMAMAYALAANIAMPIMGKPARAQAAANQANTLIMGARVAEANASDAQLETLPDWITARGYSGPTGTTRYFYPYGNLFEAANG